MKITFYDTHGFEKPLYLEAGKKWGFEFNFIETRLNADTAALAHDSQAVCIFVNDHADAETIAILKKFGVRHIALRSAGFNNVDIEAAKKNDIAVSRVPGYSPYAVAEFATGLLLTLNRKIHRSFNRVRELNFSLEGLVGFDLHGKTVGVIGAGKIGKIFAQVMAAYGCRVLIYDPRPDNDMKSHPTILYTDLTTLCEQADIISLHAPLTPETHHLIDDKRIAQMKDGVILINTSRGALIDAKALINALKKEKIGGAALDVYEEEENVFFKDLSGRILKDDTLARLLTFPNVIVTSHQAFLTKEALQNIADSTLQSISECQKTGKITGERLV